MSKMGRSMATYSQTRWWSRWEIMLQVLEQFGDVEPFLQENSDLSPATRSKLLDILHNPQSLTTLKLELAAVVDMGVHFVKATYRLEGDGLLILVCYEEILKIRAAIQSAWYPNIQAVAKNAFPSNPSLQSQWATTFLRNQVMAQFWAVT